MNQVQDIRVICTGTAKRTATKPGPHDETVIGLIGWNENARRPEHQFLAYSGPTRPTLWEEGRLVAHGMTFRFNACSRCDRNTPLSFKSLQKYAEALKAAGQYDSQGRLTLNLSAPPSVIATNS